MPGNQKVIAKHVCYQKRRKFAAKSVFFYLKKMRGLNCDCEPPPLFVETGSNMKWLASV